ncbi:MAG: glycosyltransferase, partial [Tepidisphaeraceae bacterium]
MNILFVNPTAQLGGAERVLLDVMTTMKPALPPGSRVKLLLLADGPLVRRARELGFDVAVESMPQSLARLGESGLGQTGATRMAIRTCRSLPGLSGFVGRVRRQVRRFCPDVIHSNGLKTHLLTRLMPRGDALVVWHVHDLLGERPLISRALRYFSGHVSAAVAISQAVADDLRRVLPRKQVHTILNGIDLEQFSPSPEDPALLDRLAGMPEAQPDVVRVGLVATYARWKGQDLFLDACARVLTRTDRRTLRFFIIGGAIYATLGSQFSEAALRERAIALGIESNVGFIGFQADPTPVYRALD